MSTAVANRPAETKPPKDTAEYLVQPFGGGTAFKLTIAIVKRALTTPTKGGRECSDRDAFRFIMMCKAKGLNPWEGDAFLIGYDTMINGVAVGQFSLITAHQAYLKRAEVHKEFDGMESGIVILNEDDTLTDSPGDFYLPGQKEKVVGGWARVHYKTRKIATYRRVRMERFNKGFGEWNKDAAGMICKCAEADALRSAFPTQFGGMYLAGEMSFIGKAIDVESLVLSDEKLANMISEKASPGTADEPADPNQDVQQGQGQSAAQTATTDKLKDKDTKKKAPTPQIALEQLLVKENLTFDHFIHYLKEHEVLDNPEALQNYASISEKDANRLMLKPAQLVINVRAANGLTSPA